MRREYYPLSRYFGRGEESESRCRLLHQLRVDALPPLFEREVVLRVIDVNEDRFTFRKLAAENARRQRVLDLRLDHASQWPRAVVWIVAFLREQLLRIVADDEL